MGSSIDFLSSLLDEIALEGLDGITLKMLWQRLTDRPNFPITVDDDSKIFFWKSIANLRDIQMYELAQPRKFVPIYDRFEHIDPELGVVFEPLVKIHDPYYPVVAIKDGEVRGSCATYKTRKCVTPDIRHGNVLLMSLSQVVERWGDSLVLVAAPNIRLLALIGTETNPLIDLSLEEYCLLERIGRSRYLGEVTQGEGGLLSLKALFCKQIHYHRKKLTSKHLITKQDHYMKMRNGFTSNGSLFHLTRFYVLRKTKMACLLKSVCDILREKPQKLEACKVLREQLGSKDSTFKKLYTKPFQKWVKASLMTCKEVYPDATYKEWFTLNGDEKVVKVLQLLKHCDVEDDEGEEEIENEAHALPLNVHFDSSKIYHGQSLEYQVYSLIEQAGSEGISAADLGRALTLPKLDIRNLIRVLCKKGHVFSVPRSRGRQVVNMHISKVFKNRSETYSNRKEQEEILITDRASNHNSRKRKNNFDENKGSIPIKKKPILDDDAQKILLKNHGIKLESTNEEISIETNFQNVTCEVHEVQIKSNSIEQDICLSNEPTVSQKQKYSSIQRFTYRKFKRCNMILDLLKSNFISTVGELQRYIFDKELEEEYNYRLDKKSTARLIDGLFNSKKIKKFVAKFKYQNKLTEIEFVCEKSVQKSDPCISVAIEQAKFKYFSVPKDNSKKSPKNKEIVNSENQSNLLASSAGEISMTKEKVSEDVSVQVLQHEIKAEPLCKLRCSTPKFVRAKSLHMLLYYLVYQHKGKIETGNEQHVYHESMTWKRFLPPVPEYRKEGWCLLADIYPYMPLCLFVKLVNFRRGVPGLSNYLENKEKRNYLIKFLPKNLINNLLGNRKYLFSVNEVIKILCYMGLVSIGPQVGKPKDQLFLYVHRKTSLKDTTISPPSYLHVKTDIEYDIKLYCFESEDNVNQFWLELETICFHTPLGKYATEVGKTITIIDPNVKPELKATVINKSFDEVTDIGSIPGDGLGAAGFDSGLFLHTKRNWQAGTTVFKPPENPSKDKTKAKPDLRSMQHLLKTSVVKPATRSRLQRLTKNSLLQKENKLKITKINNVKKTVEKSSQQGKEKKTKRKGIKLRTVKLRTSKRAPHYDEKDKMAMKKMTSSRSDWSPQEDSFLLLCKVASCFLDPFYKKKLVVLYTVVRDLLYEHVPQVSANKTSHSCQRRIRYMMLNPTTVSNVKVFLGEALQDTDLVKEFDKPKPPRSNKIAWQNMFTCVLEKLCEKFTLPASDRCKNITLPGSMEKFNEHFKIQLENDVFHRKGVYKDARNVEEIQIYILLSVVLSAMALDIELTQWSFLLHKVYQGYPENALQSAVSYLQKEKVITIKRNVHKCDLRSAQRSTCPYKFSMTYNNAMMTKFPKKIFKESKYLLDSLRSLNSETNIELKGDIPAGFAATVLSLVITEQLTVHIQIPDQIILFDSSLSNEARTNIVESMIHTLSDKESSELSQLLNNESIFKVPENNEYSTAMNDSEIENSYPFPNSNLSVINNSQMGEVQRFPNASRFALHLLRHEMSQPPIERVQHSHDYIVYNSCRVFCSIKQTNKFPVLPVNPPDGNEKLPDRPQTSKSEYLTIDRMEQSTDCISEISKLLTCYIPHNVLVPNKSFMDTIEALYEQYTLQTLQDAKCIFYYLYDAGTRGFSETELWQVFRNLSGEFSLFEHLRLFQDATLVIRAGVTRFTYVCCCFAGSWVLTSYQLPGTTSRKSDNNSVQNIGNGKLTPDQVNTVMDENSSVSKRVQRTRNVKSPTNVQSTCSVCLQVTEFNNKIQTQSRRRKVSSTTSQNQLSSLSNSEKVHFQPRTWRYPDGSLNKTVLLDLLSTVLSHIILAPGISTSQVCDIFSFVLPPVQILELIEILEKACCIYKYYCKPMKNSSLFSPPCNIFITEHPEPEDVQHLEPFPDALCKIAQLRNVLQ